MLETTHRWEPRDIAWHAICLVILPVSAGLAIVLKPSAAVLILPLILLVGLLLKPNLMLCVSLAVASIQTVSYYVEPLSYNFKPFEALCLILIPAQFLSMLARHDLRWPPFSRLFALFLAVAALAYYLSPAIPLTAGDILGGMGKDSPPFRFYTRTFMLLFFFLIYWAFWYLFRQDRFRVVALRALFYSSVFLSAFGSIVFFSRIAGLRAFDLLGFVTETGEGLRLRGFSYEGAVLGCYLCFPLYLGLGIFVSGDQRILRRVWILPGLGILLIGLMLTFSLSIWIACFAGGMVFMGLSRRVRRLASKRLSVASRLVIALAAIAILFVGIAYLANGSALGSQIGSVLGRSLQGERIESYRVGWELFRSNPLVGVGFGQSTFYFVIPYPILYAPITGIGSERLGEVVMMAPELYNTYLHFLAEVGLLGTCLVVVFGFQLFRSLYRRACNGFEAESMIAVGFLAAFTAVAIYWMVATFYMVTFLWLFLALAMSVSNPPIQKAAASPASAGG